MQRDIMQLDMVPVLLREHGLGRARGHCDRRTDSVLGAEVGGEVGAGGEVIRGCSAAPSLTERGASSANGDSHWRSVISSEARESRHSRVQREGESDGLPLVMPLVHRQCMGPCSTLVPLALLCCLGALACMRPSV